MGLIIKDKIPMFIIGYPTVSDKYNVQGGVLDSNSAVVQFGDLVKFGSTTGYYSAASTLAAATDIAGFVLATNVKLALDWPATSAGVKTLPGEAFNLLINGFLAVGLDASAVQANIKPNTQVYATTTGKITTVATSNFAIPGAVFTGMSELHGTQIVAEVYVK